MSNMNRKTTCKGKACSSFSRQTRKELKVASAAVAVEGRTDASHSKQQHQSCKNKHTLVTLRERERERERRRLRGVRLLSSRHP